MNGRVQGRGYEILDIRRAKIEQSVKLDLLQKLQPAAGGEKQMPTLLLYDEAGLQLFEAITYLDEYYLTNAEVEVLRNYADAVADRIVPGSVVVELGSGYVPAFMPRSRAQLWLLVVLSVQFLCSSRSRSCALCKLYVYLVALVQKAQYRVIHVQDC